MPPTRDELVGLYLDQIPYEPYPVQEEALLAWFAAEQGVLVCTPTGTGKTMIAEAALFEALHNGTTAYYTTPLIALCEQKFREMQAAAVKWGFQPDDVGLVTGNRRENPDARVLVVVAEILLNRLLHSGGKGDRYNLCEAPEGPFRQIVPVPFSAANPVETAFDFERVSAVVMDEFHSFNDLERGIVWELSLGLLPKHVRTLLLSATVGNAIEFLGWLRQCHDRRLELVTGDERKVPLGFHWVGDMLLTEHLEAMAQGGKGDRSNLPERPEGCCAQIGPVPFSAEDDETRMTPALVFCFNREECWAVAEQLKGKRILGDGRKKRLAAELERYDWSAGAGPKLKQLLMRGVGVHHAGVLPKYRRIVEDLFQHKLLSVAVCTETLAAGINLPARSVVVPKLMKGPAEKQKLLDPSTAHQIFGRAGRPQFDTKGHVYALAHEDDVKIARWREKFDQIPENTKDPGLLKAKKALKKKMPTRRANVQYWNEAQYRKLCAAPSGNLHSRGQVPWRLLAYMLDASPDIEPIRRLVGKRLMDPGRIEAGQKELDRMLMTLWRAGYVTLEPSPPKEEELAELQAAAAEQKAKEAKRLVFTFGFSEKPAVAEPPQYRPMFAHPTDSMSKLLMFRGINPLYAVFLVNQLGIADRDERVQAMESVLELPRSVGRFVRVPRHDELPPGPLATLRLDPRLLQLGLATPEEISRQAGDDEPRHRRTYDDDERVWVLTLADKLRRLFDYDFDGVHDLRTSPVWAAGELLQFGGDFNKYVTSRSLQKQEGVIFRHVLRLILLVNEFAQLCPPDVAEDQWREDLGGIAALLTESCRRVDTASTDKALEEAEQEVD
ncbi:MAG: DEAD/DEAH box helicase [Planctomycetes bacterium]|nr:DEAD/DEAH box helicase [Planctomycetota bacterium]MCG2684899.1 DEAD/DEAH box helicase [Planctomycetales bacterium]